MSITYKKHDSITMDGTQKSALLTFLATVWADDVDDVDGMSVRKEVVDETVTYYCNLVGRKTVSDLSGLPAGQVEILERT